MHFIPSQMIMNIEYEYRFKIYKILNYLDRVQQVTDSYLLLMSAINVWPSLANYVQQNSAEDQIWTSDESNKWCNNYSLHVLP